MRMQYLLNSIDIHVIHQQANDLLSHFFSLFHLFAQIEQARNGKSGKANLCVYIDVMGDFP